MVTFGDTVMSRVPGSLLAALLFGLSPAVAKGGVAELPAATDRPMLLTGATRSVSPAGFTYVPPPPEAVPDRKPHRAHSARRTNSRKEP